MTLAQLSDDELLSSLTNVCFEMHRLLGRLLLHLIEVVRRVLRELAVSNGESPPMPELIRGALRLLT